MAYIRTALTMFVAGVSFLEFFESKILEIVGFIFIFGSGALSVAGILRLRFFALHIKKVSEGN